MAGVIEEVSDKQSKRQLQAVIASCIDDCRTISFVVLALIAIALAAVLIWYKFFRKPSQSDGSSESKMKNLIVDVKAIRINKYKLAQICAIVEQQQKLSLMQNSSSSSSSAASLPPMQNKHATESEIQVIMSPIHGAASEPTFQIKSPLAVHAAPILAHNAPQNHSQIEAAAGGGEPDLGEEYSIKVVPPSIYDNSSSGTSSREYERKMYQKSSPISLQPLKIRGRTNTEVNNENRLTQKKTRIQKMQQQMLEQLNNDEMVDRNTPADPSFLQLQKISSSSHSHPIDESFNSNNNKNNNTNNNSSRSYIQRMQNSIIHDSSQSHNSSFNEFF